MDEITKFRGEFTKALADLTDRVIKIEHERNAERLAGDKTSANLHALEQGQDAKNKEIYRHIDKLEEKVKTLELRLATIAL